MIGTGEKGLSTGEKVARKSSPKKTPSTAAGELAAKARQLSLRDQLDRNHFLLERLSAASSRLIQAVEHKDVFAALGEIIGNLIGSEQVAIFQYLPAKQAFPLAWSTGVDVEILQQLGMGTGLMGRVVVQGKSQFRDRHHDAALLPWESNLNACVPLRCGNEVVGVIVVLGLLPQKNGLEWVDIELLKFLETYGGIAAGLQELGRKSVCP
jgi:GAF domain-containing protein